MKTLTMLKNSAEKYFGGKSGKFKKIFDKNIGTKILKNRDELHSMTCIENAGSTGNQTQRS